MNKNSPTTVKIGVTGWTRGTPDRRTVARYAGAAVNLPAPNRASSGSRSANSPQLIVGGILCSIGGDPVFDMPCPLVNGPVLTLLDADHVARRITHGGVTGAPELIGGL
jgi:hypothetical protein